MTPPRILVADDHAFLCEMLARRLDEAGLEVVARANDTTTALAALRRLEPDLVIFDIDMPGPSVFDVLRQQRVERPGLGVLLLSAHVTDHYVTQALELGIRGYLRKTESLDVIVEAVKMVAAGEACFSTEVRSRIAESLTGGRDPARSRLDTLTARELEILAYVARGMTKKEIAALMHRSIKTVDQHCTNLMAKLEIHDRVALTRFAIREGVTLP
jgi:DNA-binding NarL/FixJ family response regulator